MKSHLYWIVIVYLGCANINDQNKHLGAVSTATPEATSVGIDILQNGGNAIDAAVAISFVLAVTEPAMSGLGGGTQLLVDMPERSPFMINGSTRSPANTPEFMESNSLEYHQRSTIPSMVKTLYYSWEKYGSGNYTWEELLEPAIEIANKGFKVGEFRAKVYNRYGERLTESPFNSHFVLTEQGAVPEEKDVIKQETLAKTIQKLAIGGSKEFYSGGIAQEIARDMEKNGGWITYEDLAQFPDPNEITALKTTFRGYDVYTSAPPCGGWVLLVALNLLEDNENENIKAVIESLYSAHNDRLLNPVLDVENFDSIISKKLSEAYTDSVPQLSDADNFRDSGETTHFSVVDGNGISVSVTASINAYFGARAASEKLGFLYNTYMDDFVFGEEHHPWLIGPDKMAFSSMTPTIVKKNGEPVLVLGSPGSARIISSLTQVINNWTKSQDIVEAINQPRIHVNRDRVYFESSTDSTNYSNLIQDLGLRIGTYRKDLEVNSLNAYFGGVHAIAKENGIWIAHSDPRRDGTAESIE
ncbi:MAG: gamma-glutamyltransferase [Balneolaceae bacterium]|nr:gamma-glutamyltransferase [Balneolaceae bacterium]MBO6546667.1 gamma-glutamyltransferase [Balneolaceae bacterium]MBO6649025.1 gamma-glutamyltransferase [Balneolaceae bacterium]